MAHADVPAGESTALLLRLKGFVSVATSTIENLELMLEHWKPRALLIDSGYAGRKASGSSAKPPAILRSMQSCWSP
ncbi:MAG: Response regulator receiver domain protein(CheY) [uncultured Paraburkholderia sp.]|nr:MAG: Response regulator receiver domain protein(CheY) [uncultured Paraburkholderia sp.]